MKLNILLGVRVYVCVRNPPPSPDFLPASVWQSTALQFLPLRGVIGQVAAKDSEGLPVFTGLWRLKDEVSVVTGYGLQVAHQCYLSLRPTPPSYPATRGPNRTLIFKLQRLLEFKEPNTAQSSSSRAGAGPKNHSNIYLKTADNTCSATVYFHQCYTRRSRRYLDCKGFSMRQLSPLKHMKIIRVRKAVPCR